MQDELDSCKIDKDRLAEQCRQYSKDFEELKALRSENALTNCELKCVKVEKENVKLKFDAEITECRMLEKSHGERTW